MSLRSRWIIASTMGWLLAMTAANCAQAETLVSVSMKRAIQVPADGVRTYPAVITAISVQPNGRLIAAAGDDHIIRLWNMDDGSLAHRLEGHRDWIRAIAFSPDGQSLVSSGHDRQVLLWNVAEGRLASVIAVHDHAVDAVTFSHSGRWVATAGFEDKLCIFDLTVAAPAERELDCSCRDIRALAVSHDDRYLAAGGRDGVIRIWDLESSEMIREVGAHAQRIRALVFSPDGAQLISGGEDRVVRVWNWKTDDQSFTLPRQQAKILTLVACGPNILATAGSDNMIRLWDLPARRELGQLAGHTGSVAALAFHEGTLVSGGYDTFLRLWKIPDQLDEGVRSAERIR